MLDFFLSHQYIGSNLVFAMSQISVFPTYHLSFDFIILFTFFSFLNSFNIHVSAFKYLKNISLKCALIFYYVCLIYVPFLKWNFIFSFELKCYLCFTLSLSMHENIFLHTLLLLQQHLISLLFLCQHCFD